MIRGNFDFIQSIHEGIKDIEFKKFYGDVGYAEILEKEYHDTLKKFKKEHFDELEKEKRVVNEKTEMETQQRCYHPRR